MTRLNKIYLGSYLPTKKTFGPPKVYYNHESITFKHQYKNHQDSITDSTWPTDATTIHKNNYTYGMKSSQFQVGYFPGDLHSSSPIFFVASCSSNASVNSRGNI